jgi:hypothetical protein
MARRAFEWFECLLVSSPTLGDTPADAGAGVVGLVGGRGDGKGRDDVLRLASNDLISMADALLVSTGVLDLEIGGRSTGESVRIFGGSLDGSLEGPLEPLGSGALNVLPVSRTRLDRVLAEFTVFARVGLVVSLASWARSING